jgi:hypothetical protein
MKVIGTVEVDLTGDDVVDKGQLITLAYWIIYAKLLWNTPPAFSSLDQNVKNQFFLKSVAFTDHIGDVNRISAKAVVQRKQSTQNAMTIAMGNLGKPIDSSQLPTPVGNAPTYQQTLSWGAYAGQTPEWDSPATLAGIFSCYLQDPCSQQKSIYTATQSSPGNGPNQNRVTLPGTQPSSGTITVNVAPITLAVQPWLSVGDQQAIYTYWRIDNLYKTRSMNVQMPIASPVGGTQNYAATSMFITLSGGQSIRIVRIAAERLGQEPQFPSPYNIPANPLPSVGSYYNGNSTQITQTVLRFTVAPGTPEVTATGQLLYRATAEYILGLSRPPNPGEQLALGNDRWTNSGPQNTASAGTLTNSDWTTNQ